MKDYSNIKTHKVKIYRDGQLDRWETLKPYLEELGNKIDYFFVRGSWPKETQEDGHRTSRTAS